MKRCLLFAAGLVSVFFVNAQKHMATPVRAKKILVRSQGMFYPQGITAAACDTLKLDSAANLWSPFYYTEGTDGYVFGVSDNSATGFNITQDANYYDVSTTDYTYISGGFINLSIANSTDTANLAKNLVFKVYDDGGGYPGNLLDSALVPLAVANANTQNGFLTQFTFTSPVAIPANKIFYVALNHSNFAWTDAYKDSIAITADSNDQAPASAFQYLDAGAESGWVPVNQFWASDAAGDPLDVDLFLFPIVSNTLGGCGVLPVSLINFKGSLVNNKAYLTWSTAVELNNKGFEVERSADGRSFTNLGFVNGVGNSSKLTNYSYTDETVDNLGSGTGFYRLKQVDADGKFNYSNIVAISLKDAVALRLYPNPLKDKLTVELNLNSTSQVNVQVISREGKLLMNADKGTLPQGKQQMSFNIQNLAAGTYFIRVKAGDKSYTQTIIKQ